MPFSSTLPETLSRSQCYAMLCNRCSYRHAQTQPQHHAMLNARKQNTKESILQPDKIANGDGTHCHSRDTEPTPRFRPHPRTCASSQLRCAERDSSCRCDSIQCIRNLDGRSNVEEVHQDKGRLASPLRVALHRMRAQCPCCVCGGRVGSLDERDSWHRDAKSHLGILEVVHKGHVAGGDGGCSSAGRERCRTIDCAVESVGGRHIVWVLEHVCELGQEIWVCGVVVDAGNVGYQTSVRSNESLESWPGRHGRCRLWRISVGGNTGCFEDSAEL